MLNKIYNEDCLEGMKKIPSDSIDFVCADLPFGFTCNAWDKKIDLQKFWSEAKRIAKKNAAFAFFANGKFLIELAASNLLEYRYKIVWQKNNLTGFLNAKKMPLKAHEDILIFYSKLPTYNPIFTYGKPYSNKFSKTCSTNYNKNFFSGRKENSSGRRYPKDILQFNTDHFQKHPTAKPVELLEWLIKTYTNEGEIVFDPCVGSGTTAVAALNTDRNFIGFELEEKYFEVAEKRIKEARRKWRPMKLLDV